MSASIWSPGGTLIPQADPNSQVKSQIFTATEGQTLFTLTEFTYALASGAIQVYVNGAKQAASAVTETSTTSFTLAACDAGDTVEAVGQTAIEDVSGAATRAETAETNAELAETNAEAAAAEAVASAAALTGALGDITALQAAVAVIEADIVNDLEAASNLSDVANAATARTNLGLAIGTNVQAYSANLDEFAAVNPTAAGLALLDDADAAAQRATLGVLGKVGTTTNDSAAAGEIGEYISASTSGSPVSVSSGSTKTITSISLTAGDWDVSGEVLFIGNTGTTSTDHRASFHTVNNTLSTLLEEQSRLVGFTATTAIIALSPPTRRFSLAATTTIYLTAEATFAVSTMNAYGRISARRVR